MRAYTYQVGEGVGDVIKTPIHSESVTADSLGEAIIKAKAITRYARHMRARLSFASCRMPLTSTRCGLHRPPTSVKTERLNAKKPRHPAG